MGNQILRREWWGDLAQCSVQLRTLLKRVSRSFKIFNGARAEFWTSWLAAWVLHMFVSDTTRQGKQIRLELEMDPFLTFHGSQSINSYQWYYSKFYNSHFEVHWNRTGCLSYSLFEASPLWYVVFTNEFLIDFYQASWDMFYAWVQPFCQAPTTYRANYCHNLKPFRIDLARFIYTSSLVAQPFFRRFNMMVFR